MARVDEDLDRFAQAQAMHPFLLGHPGGAAVRRVDEGLRATDLGQFDHRVDRDVVLRLAGHEEVIGPDPEGVVAGIQAVELPRQGQLQVADGRARLGAGLELPLAGQLGRLSPGDYTFGVRANHLFVARQSEDDVAIEAVVELAEISGSETFIHAAHSGTAWVAQEEGVHSLGLGEAIQVFVNPRHLFAFDGEGRLMAAPAWSAAPMAAQ